jgi:predicted nucleotidyltransferase
MGWSDEQQGEALREIWHLLQMHAPGLKDRFGVERIGLFGSWVLGNAQPWSDVDLLVDWPTADIYSYVELKEPLEGIFHRKVDLVLQAQLRPEWKEWILGSVRYAA